jgi:hypothetical protein
MPRPTQAFCAALLALGLFIGGCEGGESRSPRETEERANLGRASKPPRIIESTRVPCEVGERPGYFVPGPDRPLAILGCARLGVSGKPVEFSGNLERIDGKSEICINPAYTGRGQRGFFIPAICKPDPPLSRLAVLDAEQPRQGVRGYAFVVWGTAEASTTDVVARFRQGRARAVVLNVRSKLARRFGEPPFSLFVVELPLEAACATVTVGSSATGATEQIRPRRRVCERG